MLASGEGVKSERRRTGGLQGGRLHELAYDLQRLPDIQELILDILF